MYKADSDWSTLGAANPKTLVDENFDTICRYKIINKWYNFTQVREKTRETVVGM